MRSPEGKPVLLLRRRTHCKFGYFLFLTVGLYFPLSFLSFQTIIEPLLHIAHFFAIINLLYQNILILARLCYYYIIMEYIFLIIILILSIIIHEVAHGSVAYYLGDPTAKYAGRLTLNPLKHLDPIGSIILPIFLIIFKSPILFGYAKPVPINPRNFRDQKYGSMKVALAGPASNLAIAVFFGLILRFFPGLSALPGLIEMFSFIVYINILLAIFNLLPIPPLDGSHILFALLPLSARNIKIFLQQFGLFILLFIIFFAFRYIILIISWIFILITGFPLF